MEKSESKDGKVLDGPKTKMFDLPLFKSRKTKTI